MALNLVGFVFGDLTVIKYSGRVWVSKSKVWRTQWLCKCLCGKECLKFTTTLRTDKTKSCGCCEWHIHHNEAYNSWQAAKQRCYYTQNKDYISYGGRGIIMSDDWKNSFTCFFRDMGDPPIDSITHERYSLDRIDNNGNYTKENCKWSCRSEQQLNKRSYTWKI